MRKVLSTLAACLAFSVMPAYASVASGYFECKVKQQRVLVVEDGEHKTYSKINEHAGVGDPFEITYRFIKRGDNNNNLNIELDWGTREGFSFSIFVNRLKLDEPEFLEAYYEEEEGGWQEDTLPRVRLNNGYAILSGKYGKTIRLDRYFKNHWAGIFTDPVTLGMSTMVSTFDCRHVIDGLDEIRNILRKSNS